MFVHDLNCSWMVHPLFVSRFRLETEQQWAKLRELGIRELYIDTALGDDVAGAPSAEDIRQELEGQILALTSAQGGMACAQAMSGADIDKAVDTRNRAQATIVSLMRDARLGRQLDTPGLEDEIGHLTESLLRSSPTLINLSRIKTRDDYTFQHSVGVCTLLTVFCNTLHLGKDITRQVSIGALLHDLGKMKVADAILNKPGRLTQDEFEEMKRHVEYGRELIAQMSWIGPISRDVLSQHHERYDGSGYPFGLRGDEISQFGQMAAIVDVYDAITADRVYHKALSPADAVRKLQEWSAFHFNQELVGHFIRSIGIYPRGTLVRLESGLLGLVSGQNPEDLLRPSLRVVYDSRKQSRVSPYNMDLSDSGHTADRIVGYEAPEDWGIDVAANLDA